MRKNIRFLACFGCMWWFLSMQVSEAAIGWQGHFYEYVPVQCTWNQAKTWTDSITFEGYPGHLANVTSAEEDAFIRSIVPPSMAQVFLGGTDATTEGTWVWETGPEAGTIFWKDGASYGGAYTNWRPGEPNHYFPSEDYLVMYQGGWNDAPGNDYLHQGYVVEYEWTDVGFEFGMTSSHLGGIRNISPRGRLDRLDITLAGDTFFDSAPTVPGEEYTEWSVLAASEGASFQLPDNAATDGEQTVTLQLGLYPTEGVLFQVDLDRFSNPDGQGIAPGTVVTAYFSEGEVKEVLSGTVGLGDILMLGRTYPYSVRVFVPESVPIPTSLILLGSGLAGLVGLRRKFKK